MFGGHVRAVFTLVLFIFIACVIATVRSFREIPMDRLWANKGGGLSSTTCDQLSIVTEHKPKVNIKSITSHPEVTLHNSFTIRLVV